MMTPQTNSSIVESTHRLASMGRVFFGAGIVLVVLRGLTLATRMPGLPTFWYANQSLWVITGFGMIAIGWQILWGPPLMSPSSWQPTIPGRRFHKAILYFSEGCHLCDDADALLKKYQKWLPNVEPVDIQSDAKLVERFSTCVPVVELDGKVRFRGRIDESLLRRLIEGTRPLSSSVS